MNLIKRPHAPLGAGLLLGLASVLSASAAAAQTEAPAAEAAPPAETATPAEPPPAEPAPVAPAEAPPAEATAEMDASASMSATGSMEAPMTEPMPAEGAAAEEVPAEEAPLGTPSLFAFVDAWAGFQSAKSGGPGGGGVYANNGPGGTAESGFGLNWLGADIGYDGGEWGMTGSLRFGDAVALYGTGTLGPITNAFATWRPTEGLSFDMGTFGTIYGAEVAESWLNLNYTRGELYFNYQPFWHTGLRAQYEAGDLVFRGLLVNAPNSSNLGGDAMNAGVQVGYSSDTFGLIAGLLQSLAPETTANNSAFVDTFVDVVLTVTAGDFSLVGNFDFNAGSTDGIGGFWGGSLAAGYSITQQFGVAVRGEYLATEDAVLYGAGPDPDDPTFDASQNLITGTLTLDLKPIEGVDNFVVRWDNRIEAASEDVYADGDGVIGESSWFSSTFGFVAYGDLL